MKENILHFFAYLGRKLNVLNICIDKNEIAKRLTILEKKVRKLELYTYDDGR
jgi:hypothetical protein